MFVVLCCSFADFHFVVPNRCFPSARKRWFMVLVTGESRLKPVNKTPNIRKWFDDLPLSYFWLIIEWWTGMGM
jgi:hypothetical protein